MRARIGAGVLAAAVVVYAAVVQLAGGAALGFLWYLFLSAALLVLPGAQIAAVLLPNTPFDKAARFACAYALGAAFLALNYMAVGLTPLPLWCAFICPVLLGGVWIWKNRARRVPALTMEMRTVFCCLCLCLAAAMAVYLFTGVLAFAHTTAAGNLQYHQDMLWSVGNGAAVRLGFPLRDIRVAGATLHYHFLSDAIPGLLAYAGGLSTFDAACYYNYPVVLSVLVCALYAAARAYGAKTRYAALLPFAVLFLQGFGSEMTLNVLRNLNGVGAAMALTCVCLYLVCQTQQPDFRLTARFVLAFCLCMGALLLSKNLYGILLLCAMAAAVAAGAVQRRFYRAQLVLTLCGACVLALCWVLLYRHAINNLVSELWLTPWQLAGRLAAWLPLGAALWCVSLVYSLRRFGTLPFARLTVNAAALGGMVAYVIFHHYSGSQIYFLLAALLFVWFCALDALAALAAKWMKVLAGALAAASLCGALLTLMPVARTGVQIALRCAGVRPQYPAAEDTVTADDERIALWLRENLAQDAVFATNRNAKSAEIGEGTWHYLTAISERQAYVESWRYAMDYGADYTTLRYQLEQVSDTLFAMQSAEEAFALARAHDIDYLVVSKALRKAPYTGAEPVFENTAAAIYRVE